MTGVVATKDIAKLATGIAGLDTMLRGGLPVGRTTLITGTAGSGKTVLGLQFLVEGARRDGGPGVLVTFEEPPDAIRQNARSLAFDIDALEADNRIVFIDATEHDQYEQEVVGNWDLGGLLARIARAVELSGATRVTVDSFGALFGRFADTSIVRRELLKLAAALREMNVTTVMTSERTDEYGAIGRFGIEEFVCDNVIVLRNVLAEETRRRTVEVLKLRGVDHDRGEFPFTIRPGVGFVVLRFEGSSLDAESATVRTTSGVSELDAMCDGGLLRDSVILVSGATGTGKTLLVTQFVDGGAAQGERSLLLSYEESRAQIHRNAAGWNRDFAGYEESGLLKVLSIYPETRSLEDHLIQIKTLVDEYRPTRIAVDSLSALERVAPGRNFREFLIGLSSLVKLSQTTALFTSTARTLLGGESTTDMHISTLTDMIVLLRYVEMEAEVRRGITVLKLRGSAHDKSIRQFVIDGTGMHIGAPFRDVSGILSGMPRHQLDVEFEARGTPFEGER